MIDDVNDGIAGVAAKEMDEECGIKIRPSEMIDLSKLAFADQVRAKNLPCAGIPPSPGGCDEYIRYMYYEKKVSMADLDQMRGRLSGLRDEGEYITLRVVSINDMWRISADSKVIW
jgi:ADP-sugar diphosphatase